MKPDKIMTQQEINGVCDSLTGNRNRICVTDSKNEIVSRLASAINNLFTLAENRILNLDQEQKIKEIKQSNGENIIRKYNELLQNKLSNHFEMIKMNGQVVFMIDSEDVTECCREAFDDMREWLEEQIEYGLL